MPNYSALRPIGAAAWDNLAVLLASLTPAQHRVLLAVLKMSGGLERLGDFTFLQKVYFLAGSEDFLDNYCVGYVLGAGPDRTVVVSGEKIFALQKNLTVAYLLPSSLYTAAEFKEHKARLLRKGLAVSPDNPPPRRQVDIDYEPPSLDDSQVALEARAASSGKKPKKNSQPAPQYLEVEL